MGLPHIVIAKKNGTIRLVSDFRKLNALLKKGFSYANVSQYNYILPNRPNPLFTIEILNPFIAFESSYKYPHDENIWFNELCKFMV
jgi:hypothetical protein